MIDLTKIDATTLQARGAYSTVNSALKDEYRNVQILSGEATSALTKILRHMQPDGDAMPEHPRELLAVSRAAVDGIEAAAARIVTLAQQKRELRDTAWGKKP